MSTPLARLALCLLFAFCAQSAWGSWQYSNGQTDTTPSGFTYQTTVTENPANTFTGTAVLTAFSGTSASIPPTVPIQITVNTTNSEGQPIQYDKTVNCTVQEFRDFTLNSDASFTGDVNIIGDFNLNGNDLMVNGKVIHQSGSIYFGTLPSGSTDSDIRFEITGDYIQGADWDGDGIYETYCNGRLYMTDAAGYMKVGGNARFCCYLGYGYGSPWMSAGTLEILGNFKQELAANGYGVDSYRASGTHRTLLSGTGTQTVSFASPDPSYYSCLATLEVTNPNPLVFLSVVPATKVTSPAPLVIQSPGEGGVCGTLECDITFSGTSFTMLSTTDLSGHAVSVDCPVKQVGHLNLNGGSFTVTGTGGWDQRNELYIGTGGNLTVPGSFIHRSGSIYLVGGSLDIGGDYIQGADWDGDGIYETTCNGRLYMTDAAGHMKIGGNARFCCYLGYGYPQMSAGTLEILGNFKQELAANGYGANSFQASGTHRTLLSGTGNQTVSLENPGPGESYFNIIELTNPDLADTSTITIANGGSIHLNYTGTDVVGALYLGGLPQPNGLYDSTNTGGLITGNGKLQIGPFADFTAWASAIAPGQTTDQDHDQDGVPNGVEYFMGRSGNGFTANPGIAPDGTVTWPKSPAFNGSYAVQASVDLVVWTDVTDDPTQVTKSAGSVLWTSPTVLGTRFVRLIVTPN